MPRRIHTGACARCGDALFGAHTKCGKCGAAFHAQCCGRSAQDVHKAFTCAGCASAPTLGKRSGGPSGGPKRSKVSKSERLKMEQNKAMMNVV